MSSTYKGESIPVAVFGWFLFGGGFAIGALCVFLSIAQPAPYQHPEKRVRSDVLMTQEDWEGSMLNAFDEGVHAQKSDGVKRHRKKLVQWLVDTRNWGECDAGEF